MKKLRIHVLACVILLAIGFLLLKRLGGLGYVTNSGYRPVVAAKPATSPGFHLAVSPHFTSGGGSRCIIPYLLFTDSSSCKDPQIVIQTNPSSDYYGYHNMAYVVIEELTVRNESGREFKLIPSGSPRKLSLTDFSENLGREYVGGVDGKTLAITAKGHVVTKTGEDQTFSQEQTWHAVDSSRIGLAAWFGE